MYRYSVKITILMALFFIGIIIPLHYAFFIAVVLLYIYILSDWMISKSIALPKLIIISILLQNTLMGIGMYWFGVKGTSITFFSQISTLFIFIAGTWIIIKQRKAKAHYLFYIYVLVILFNYIISPNKSLTAFAYNTRNFVIFYLAYIIGTYFIDSEKKFEDFKIFFIRCAFVAGIIGIIGLITSDRLYVLMGAVEVANVKALNSGIYTIDGLPGYFLGDFFGTYLWRMASLFLEPVNFSSFMALAVVLKSTMIKKITDYFTLLFLLICNFLTFGKGGLLIAGVSLIVAFSYHVFIKELKIGTKPSFSFIKWGLIGEVAILGIYYGVFYSYNMHFYAIKITMAALMKKPFGFGVGSVGNVNKFINQSESYLGAETGVLNFWCQLGIEGVIVFAWILQRISRESFKTFRIKKDSISFIFALMPILLFLVFIFQENIFTTQVITGYMFVEGYISNIYKRNLTKEDIRITKTLGGKRK